MTAAVPPGGGPSSLGLDPLNAGSVQSTTKDSTKSLISKAYTVSLLASSAGLGIVFMVASGGVGAPLFAAVVIFNVLSAAQGVYTQCIIYPHLTEEALRKAIQENHKIDVLSDIRGHQMMMNQMMGPKMGKP